MENKIINDITSNLISTYHRELLEKNKKIVGHVCSFMPQEIIDSFGAVPYRMRATGSKSSGKAEVYFAVTHCSFVRHTFNQALSGEYDFMDTVIIPTTCDHARRIYDNWKYAQCKPEKAFILPVPHICTPSSIKAYAEDLRKITTVLEEALGVEFSEENLLNSIKKYNKQREILNEINELRKLQPPPVSGSEMMKIYQAISSMLVDDANKLLVKVLGELRNKKIDSDPNKLRILFGSSHYEDHAQLETIESENMVVVQDGSCIGTGHFTQKVGEEGDPFENLAERFLNRYSCPKVVDKIKDRVSFFFDMKDEWNCDGIIMDPLQFCTYWATEGFLYDEEAKKRGVPTLSLSHEIYGGGLGQLKTRVEAFREQILNSRKKV